MFSFKCLSQTVRLTLCLGLLAVLASSAIAQDQLPTPGPEFDVLKKDVGVWDVEIKTWSAPDAEPELSTGTETNRMLGGYWLLSDFKGNMMGLDFQGHGTYGYDSEKKQYIGSWMDSMSPTAMHMTGSWDEATNTLTMMGEAIGPDGKMMEHILVTTHQKDGTRVFTMHMQPKGSDQKTKFFEMVYTKRK